MQIFRDENSGLLKVAGTLHVSEAEDLRHALCDCLAHYPALYLDLSEVDACDTACLQLFYAARNAAIRGHKPFRVNVLSSAVAETGKMLGMPLELLMSDICSVHAEAAKRGHDGAE